MSSLKICPECGAEYELRQRFCPKDGTTLRRGASAPSLTRSPKPGGRRLPLALGAGELALVGVLATTMVLRRDGSKPDEAVNVTPAGRAPSDMSPPWDTAAEVSAALDSMERILSATDATPAQAGDALRTLEQMRGRIRSNDQIVQGNDQIVQAGIVEAFAQSIRHHQAEACAALRPVETAARRTRRASIVTTAVAAACA